MALLDLIRHKEAAKQTEPRETHENGKDGLVILHVCAKDGGIMAIPGSQIEVSSRVAWVAMKHLSVAVEVPIDGVRLVV